MKRNLSVAIILLACLAPFTLVSGQEKKSEQKIKIVVSDGKGEKTVIDTVLTGTAMKDSIRLKDGKVIYIGHSADGLEENSNIYVFSHSGTAETEQAGDHKTMAWVSASSDSPENKVIVINSDAISATSGTVPHAVIVKKGHDLGNAEKTRYVISRDGMVISVEGDDYAKVKGIVDEIEAKLNADKPAAEKSEAAKNQKKK
jgi:hypothetical protein